MGAAHVNRMVVAAADRCGTERGLEFLGWSAIVDSDGWLAAPPAGGGPATVTALVDLAKTRDKTWGRHNDLLGDRSPQAYRGLTSESSQSPSSIARTEVSRRPRAESGMVKM
jgi:predicted amidohydrolase